MAFTSSSDLYGAAHEDGFNLIVQHVMQQRPSLFNYGTASFLQNSNELFCKKIEAHPEVTRRENPLASSIDFLPVPGTNLGVEFCLQVTSMAIDFHPGNQFDLPNELNPPLNRQQASVHIEVCAAIACPEREIVERVADELASLPSQEGKDKNGKEDGKPVQPLPFKTIECFCLDIFATAHSELIGSEYDKKLGFRLDGLEIVDIKPEGLENSLECYVETIIRLSLLPNLRFPITTLLLEIPDLFSVAFSPASVINNPAVEEDQVKLFVDLEVSA